MMRSSLVASVLVLLCVTPIPMRAQRAGGSADEVITIDGAKHPELIPQWTVWNAAFSYRAKDDTEQLPTLELRAITREQSLALMKGANARIASWRLQQERFMRTVTEHLEKDSHCKERGKGVESGLQLFNVVGYRRNNTRTKSRSFCLYMVQRS